jgi:hypothetical protein
LETFLPYCFPLFNGRHLSDSRWRKKKEPEIDCANIDPCPIGVRQEENWLSSILSFTLVSFA